MIAGFVDRMNKGVLPGIRNVGLGYAGVDQMQEHHAHRVKAGTEHGVPSGGLAAASRPTGTAARHREFGVFLEVLACSGKSAGHSKFAPWNPTNEEICHLPVARYLLES